MLSQMGTMMFWMVTMRATLMTMMRIFVLEGSLETGNGG